MDDKTEAIDLKEIDALRKNKTAKKKKRTSKKKTIDLGIWKYFIAIGGVLIASIIFFTVLFYNSRGGLVTITLDDYLKANKLEERTLIYIGSDDAISKELDPIIQNIAKRKNHQYQYLNMSKIKDPNDIAKVQNVFVETQNSLVIPMILVVENGKIVDMRKDKTTGTPTGMMMGYLDEASLIAFLEKNDMY